MKKPIIPTLLVGLLLNSCEFNQSVNTDLTTGAYSRGDGLTCDEVTLEINEEKENRNTFLFGEKINFSFNNIKGFKKEDGKVFPDLSLFIIENEADTIIKQPNLLNDLNDGTALDPLLLQAHFLSVLPFKNGQKYKVNIHIWDKKGDGTFFYELPFTIEESKLLTITPKDIDYSNIYLWNESDQHVVFDNHIQSDDLLILILEGLNGLARTEGKVYPILSVNLTDRDGKKIIDNPNVLREYEISGIDAEGFTENQTAVNLSFTKGLFNNPYQLTVLLTDQKSSKNMVIKTELVLE